MGQVGVRTRALAALGALALCVGAALLAPPAGADGGGVASRPGGAMHSPAVGAESAADAVAFWTPQRMAQAEPRGLVGPGAAEAAGATGEGVGLSEPVPRPYTNRPDRMVGRIFGQDAQGLFWCSGAIVTAVNRSVVWTAGHCVFNTEIGQWATQLIFVPAYSSSRRDHRPYGAWPAFDAWSHVEWVNYANLEVDVGALVLRPRNRQRIEQRVGAHRIGFNHAVTGVFRPYGYPALPPFSGYDQWRCASLATGRDVITGFGPPTIRISCDLNAGSSGGPWLRSINSQGIGTVSSVISYGYGDPTELYGPYLGDQAKAVYRGASTERPS